MDVRGFYGYVLAESTGSPFNDDAVEIAWKALAPSRNFKLDGRVAATVRLRKHDDGQSILMTFASASWIIAT
jgi:hypothetical protein